MKRAKGLYETMLTDENLERAVRDVIRGHRWLPGHRPNIQCREIESNIPARVEELRAIIGNGFRPSPLKVRRHWDKSADKWRDISEPRLWPDQAVHHAVIQVLQPIFLRGMDYWCVGSVKGRGANRGKRGIERWLREDKKGTRYCLSADIRHFYDSLNPGIVFEMLKRKVKDRRLLSLVWAIIRDGFPIGTYYSQWFANFALQDLDETIRRQAGVSHYVRYMDNFTVFGPNKRKLHAVRRMIGQWLAEHGMELKGDWQVYPTAKRQPQAMGYRYSRKGARLKKRNALRLKRQLSECRRRMRQRRVLSARFAMGLLSRMGQLRHCRSVTFYAAYVPRGLQHILKHVAKEAQKSWIGTP